MLRFLSAILLDLHPFRHVPGRVYFVLQPATHHIISL